MKKTSLVLITTLISAGINASSDTALLDVPPCVTDVKQAVVLNFKFQEGNDTHLCDAAVDIYEKHLNVVFQNCAPSVTKGCAKEAQILAELRKLINTTRPDLINVSIKDYIYR